MPINLLKPHKPAKQKPLSLVFKKSARGTWTFARPLVFGLSVGIVTMVGFVLFLALAYGLIYRSVNPDINKLLNLKPPESTKIFAKDGSLLYEVYSVKRTPVPLTQISRQAVEATIAVEDKDFYKHNGIDIKSLIRSAIADYQIKDAAYGGSTITQQLVKNALLNNQKTFSRKVAEAVWAIAVGSKLSKDQILELYLNQISYGRNASGIEAAAQTYFGVSAKDLDLAQSAYLAALPQAPSLYNPEGPNKDALVARKNYILQLMRDQGYINDQKYNDAVAEKVAIAPLSGTFAAPYFVLWIRQQLIDTYGAQTVAESGLRVYTTLDPKLQDLAEQTVGKFADINAKKYNGHNAALVAIDPRTGGVLAMVGGKNYFGESEPKGCVSGYNCTFDANVNVATSLRQPGSSFKPYVYVTAFGPRFSYGPSSIILDAVTNFAAPGAVPYIPHNYNNAQYGRVPMRKALAGSLNVSAVRTETLVGVDNVIKTAEDVGITSPLKQCGLSLALGGCEVTLLDHVAGFSVFANGGRRNPVTGIARIEDSDGKTLLDNQTPANEQVVDPQAVYKLISIMTDNKSREFIFGPKTPLEFTDRAVAAKTGTTQNWKDGWTVGFTPSLAAGVWVGNNDGKLLSAGADGVFVAAPMWHQFMEQALAGTPAEAFPVPSGIVFGSYNPATGKPAVGSGPTEVFADYDLQPKTGKPRVLAAQDNSRLTSGSGENFDAQPAEQGPNATIISPENFSQIPKGPFMVSVDAQWQPKGSVELYVDGQLVQTLKFPDFDFTVPGLFDVGQHVIAARAKNPDGLYGKSDSVHVDIVPSEASDNQFVPIDSTPP